MLLQVQVMVDASCVLVVERVASTRWIACTVDYANNNNVDRVEGEGEKLEGDRPLDFVVYSTRRFLSRVSRLRVHATGGSADRDASERLVGPDQKK
jgi:hypothetical protein